MSIWWPLYKQALWWARVQLCITRLWKPWSLARGHPFIQAIRACDLMYCVNPRARPNIAHKFHEFIPNFRPRQSDIRTSQRIVQYERTKHSRFTFIELAISDNWLIVSIMGAEQDVFRLCIEAEWSMWDMHCRIKLWSCLMHWNHIKNKTTVLRQNMHWVFYYAMKDD